MAGENLDHFNQNLRYKMAFSIIPTQYWRLAETAFSVRFVLTNKLKTTTIRIVYRYTLSDRGEKKRWYIPIQQPIR